MKARGARVRHSTLGAHRTASYGTQNMEGGWLPPHGSRRPAALGPRGWGRVGGSGGRSPQLKALRRAIRFWVGGRGAGVDRAAREEAGDSLTRRTRTRQPGQRGRGAARLGWSSGG